MTNKISKGLLKEVLGKEIAIINSKYFIWTGLNKDDIIGSWVELCINIYELAHKCKEFALELGYELRSWNKRCEIIEISRKYYIDVPTIKKETELEAIIEAAQFIYNKNKGSHNE